MVQKFYNILVTKKSETEFVATLPGSEVEATELTEEKALSQLFFLLYNKSVFKKIIKDE